MNDIQTTAGMTIFSAFSQYLPTSPKAHSRTICLHPTNAHSPHLLGERLLARSDKVQAQRLEDALNMLDAYNQALKGSVDQFARMFEAELIGQFTLDTQQTLATGPARTGVLRLDNTVLLAHLGMVAAQHAACRHGQAEVFG